MKQEFTAWCQQSDGRGTIWIGSIELETDGDYLPYAKLMAREACAADWGADDCSDIHCLGLAMGNVEIIDWEDLNDD